jgi:hypothetical protein
MTRKSLTQRREGAKETTKDTKIAKIVLNNKRLIFCCFVNFVFFVVLILIFAP